MIKELENIGFSEKEAQIYTALVRHREISAPKIALILNIDRRTVYDVINSLFHKGYVSRKKVQSKEVFSAVNPEIILDEFTEKIADLRSAIPLFNKEINKSEEYQEINVLYGVKAISLLINKALKSKSEVFMMGRGGYLLEQLGESKHQFVSKLNSLNWKMIQTHDYKKYSNKSDFVPKEIRYLPDNVKFGVAYIVFDDKLYFFTKKKEIMLIEIVDDKFADTFKAYFSLFWKVAKA
ncbi:MAG: helix-turn-helix domain-containing protein [Nanoarchaeota archaeon]